MLPFLSDLCYEERLKTLKLPTLKHRRLRGDMIQTYKIFNHIDDIEPERLFRLSPAASTRNTGNKIYIEYSRTNTRKYSFSNRVAPAWNLLSSNIKEATNTNIFKNRLDQDQNFSSKKFDFDT